MQGRQHNWLCPPRRCHENQINIQLLVLESQIDGDGAKVLGEIAFDITVPEDGVTLLKGAIG